VYEVDRRAAVSLITKKVKKFCLKLCLKNNFTKSTVLFTTITAAEIQIVLKKTFVVFNLLKYFRHFCFVMV
jgi:hypothetical protein